MFLLVMCLNQLSSVMKVLSNFTTNCLTITSVFIYCSLFPLICSFCCFPLLLEEGLQTLLLMETLTKAGCEPGSWPSPAVSFEGPLCNKAHWLGHCRRKPVAWALPGSSIQLGLCQSSRSCSKGRGHYGNRSTPRDPRAGFPIRNHNKLSNLACGAVKKCM